MGITRTTLSTAGAGITKYVVNTGDKNHPEVRYICMYILKG